MLRAAVACALLGALAGYVLQHQREEPPRELPPPTDIDPQLTEQLRRLEKQFCDAVLHRDADILDSLVGRDFTLRIADVPQSSLPRATWMDNALNRIRGEWCEQNQVAARKLADDFAAVSLVWSQKATTDGRDFSGDFYLVDLWKKSGGTWQIVARYSAPLGKPPDRGSRQPPPATDIDLQLTEQLSQLEQEFGDAILQKNGQALERLVGPEYTLSIADFPGQSLPRAIWMDNTLNRLKAESFEHHHDAARKLADDLAVVSLLFTQKASMNGRDLSGTSYLVDFWKKRGGSWRIIARYGSRVGWTPP